MKTFQEYDEATLLTDLKFKHSDELFYIALGVTGEAGEIADHIKKSLREDGGKLTSKRRELILKEMGDTLWYLNKMARVLGSNLSEVAQMNITKLASRRARGKINGSGDNR